MIPFFTIHKLILSLLLSFLLFGVLNAQQIPIFDQYKYSPELFNPAYMGDGFFSLQYKMDFMDLDKSYAPQSFAISSDLSSILNLSQKKIGFGLSLISDKAHIINLLKVKASFAYHLIKNENNDLSAGIEAGVLSQKMDFSDTRITDPIDAVIYDGVTSKAVFDGGFGLQYRYTISDGQEFNVNIAMPQLFTSDLIYNEGREFDISTHILAGLSYRFPVGEGFGLEPLLLYREVGGGKKLKKGNVDLSIRGHFLYDRLWFGVGTRLAASSYNFSFGVKVIDNFNVAGSFELHNFLGNSWEILLLYTFNVPESKPKPVVIDTPKEEIRPVPPPLDAKSETQRITSELKALELETTGITSKIIDLKKEVNQNLQIAKRAYDESQYIGLSKGGITAKLSKTDELLKEAGKGINQIVAIAIAANQNMVSAQQLVIEAEGEGINSKKINKYWNNTKEESDQAVATSDEVVKDYTRLVGNIRNVEKSNGIFSVDLNLMVTNKDLRGLEDYYQSELNGAIGLPEKIKPVKVSTDGFSVYLTYEFPYNRENFNLEKEINRQRFLADHILQQIKELKAENINIESITMNASMQERVSSLENTPISTPYVEEFGFRVTVDYRFFDDLEKTIDDASLTIQKGEINLKELACLKLYGFKRYFNKNGTDTSFNLEMTAPNYNQIEPQVYSIVIEVK